MAERTSSRARLDQPVSPRGALPRATYDPDVFGRIAERIARFIGTARFLVYLTIFCIAWIGWNVLVPPSYQFDSYANKFTLLTLILSLQASYAAPLILLAQNRQADRDRVGMEEDRGQNQRLQADVEYLTRELASLRLSLGDVATRDFLRDQLRDLTEEVVARTTEGVYDQQSKAKREDRERRAERKKRRALTAEPNAPLSEPFEGGDEPG